ncbi:hypothetical protein [Bacillus cereus group sp. Bce040]|uniref:hypothetical protein n=1 Tax=Bacillus cereus group sp. Bce040 TaxID=3445229 RepID=UPI003F2545E6
MEKKYEFMDTDNIYGQRKDDEKNWEEFGELAQETFKNWTKYNDGTSGVKAKTWQDSGRGCVRCGGSLMVFEEAENGNVLLECKSCGYHQWNADIAPYSQKELKQMDKEAKQAGATGARHLPDELYRTIPDSLILQYVEMREKRAQGY